MYVEFLRAMAERPHLWKALPRDVAAWWRSRDLDAREIERGVVRVGDVPEEVTLEPPLSA
jgi:hypothetical protein